MDDDPKDKRLDDLFAAARRAEFYDAGRELGFETRVMSKIRTAREVRTPFFLWAWRLVPAFILVVVVLGIWASVSEPPRLADLSDVSRIGNEETMLVASLTGE